MPTYFYIATATWPNAFGHVVSTSFRPIVVESGVRRSDVAAQIAQVYPQANILFFYLEEEYMAAGQYAMIITVQSPQNEGGGYALRSWRETVNIVEGTTRSAAFATIREELQVQSDWIVVFFELRPDVM